MIGWRPSLFSASVSIRTDENVCYVIQTKQMTKHKDSVFAIGGQSLTGYQLTLPLFRAITKGIQFDC